MYMLALPGILFFIVFCYLPMIGIVIAFQDFQPLLGILGSPFVGFKNFEFFFTSANWKQVTINTLYLNVIFIVTGTVATNVVAIILSEIVFNRYKRITQSLIILPNFISWAVVAMFAVPLFSSDGGIINGILTALNMRTVNFYTNSGIWPGLLTVIRLWKYAGFGSIVSLAIITGIDPELYEAARIDGATRLKCIIHITIPHLKTIVIMQTIMAVGGIFYGDFGMIYAMVGDNPLLYPTIDVIDTFVYRMLRGSPNMGYPSAVGLYQSAVGFIMVLTANAVAKKFEPDSAIF